MRLLQDPAHLSDTVAAIYDCVLDPGRWEGVLGRLAGELGAQRATLGCMTLTGEIPSVVATYQIERTPELERISPLNPVLPIGLVLPPDRAFVISRDYGLDAFKATRFYREYSRARGDLDMICFLVTREGNSFGHWAVITQEDRGPITQDEVTGFELVAPHMRRAVEISRVLGAQTLAAETYRSALGQLDSPVLIVDGGRRIAFANPRAEAALEGGQVLRLREGRLQGATAEAEAALRRAAERRVGGLEQPLTGTDGEERLLFGVALHTGLAEEAPLTLLVLRSPREDTRNPVAIAARVFDLTPMQVQVLAFLAQGHAPDAIAEILGVSTATVRTHLAELFRRTGTSRQAELVARTLSLASPLRGG